MAALLTMAHGSLAAQDRDAGALVERLAAMTAVSGYEQALTDTLLRLLPGSRKDRAGNVLLTVGDGEPKRLIACGVDEPGYVIGNVRDDGWLTLRRVVGTGDPLFDQQLEGQRVTVFGRSGSVPGVVAVKSTHLTRGRGGSDEPFSVDGAYVDVGASNSSDIDKLGIANLSPVALTKQPHRYGTDLLAAPSVGRRAACAALLRAALKAKPTGRTLIAFTVEGLLSGRGLASLGQTAGPFARTIVVGAIAGAPREQPVRNDTTLAGPRFGPATHWDLPVRYAGTPVETVSLEDVASLSLRLRAELEKKP
jgi:putative aminopeptidase FrvX